MSPTTEEQVSIFALLVLSPHSQRVLFNDCESYEMFIGVYSQEPCEPAGRHRYSHHVYNNLKHQVPYTLVRLSPGTATQCGQTV